jgi:hypothetical protein
MPSGTFDKDGQIDTGRGVIVCCFGKKHSGKSILALVLFMAYPRDKVVIDIAGDDGPIGPDIIEIRGTVDDIPRTWPEHLRVDDKPMTLRYVPDPGSPTFLEDIDAVIALAMSHGHCAVLIHEIGVAAPAGRTQPHMRRLLMHNRHAKVTAFFCGPRPMTIDPLVLAQADLVYIFELRNPADRRRIAETIGWDPAEFDALVLELVKHGYLRFDANEEKPEDDEPDYRLVAWPPLPEDIVMRVKAYAQGTPERRPSTRVTP